MKISGRLTAGVALVAITLLGGAGMIGAQEKKTVKIAYVGPLTGPNTAMGIGTRNSLELAIREANASNALPFKLELVSETDDSKPSTGVAAVQKLCNDPDVVAASAHWNSPVALATIPYFQQCGLLNLVSGASVDDLTRQGVAEIARVNTPFAYLLPHLAKSLTADLKIMTIAIVKSRDAFGEAGSAGFIPEYQKLGGKVVAEEGYNVGDRDFTALLTKVRSLRPDAVYLSGLTTEAALVARQMRQLGMQMPLIGHAGWQTSTFIEAAGEAGEGAIVVTSLPFLKDLPGGEGFAKRYAEANFKEPAEAYGPFGYAAGQVMVDLLKRYGADRKAIVKGVREPHDFETIFGKGKFDASGELQPKYVDMAVLKNRDWVPLRK
ncbi:branched-chain amino acid ABC transporter substrate-binding protein [Bradyrhizobium sp. NP1]|uniref:branched-chain amino acid ABC transporter substrate-binding protein n=1 Tax=Bradyrhizobium sp. NP1 TaxID=3049772 RepID=UPI0025A62A9A|nr:branched-chain amino acid ABC transporter substrate-binding protein [Bradyrhizobium sp. NP1]WJR76629.1 branched-chain amino acid ABC transporter substrate-binding protein [Bradyrhizobium sp. NP1]